CTRWFCAEDGRAAQLLGRLDLSTAVSAARDAAELCNSPHAGGNYMSESAHRDLRDLVAAAVDGDLTTSEAFRLSELLLADPVAQDACLDHLYLHALLDYEHTRPAGPLMAGLLPADQTARSGASLSVDHKPMLWATLLVV